MSQQQPVRYFYIRPELDTRPIEDLTCSICRKKWQVRIPSVGQNWSTCPECESKMFIETLAKESTTERSNQQ